ncbi:nucleoid-associated protein [Bacillus norwichensis]|uniref:Nucleoid-associated protein n=1 Tax=Bacillus norwichensis TaxID=2762217 RepID=A0ABR8VG63_9BACI|nr:nucleoid-associated protein [Bacillus norwichensis]MBD8003775.1 nucleoid-associated protein [Bacillus norwichensis]
MSLVQTLNITRMAINAIDLNASEPQLSEELFPIGSNDKVIDDFFQTHFIETREGKSTKSCKFIDEDATVKTKIARFASNKTDEEFIKLSRELTENLFKIMKNSSSNSSGTFFVFEVELDEEQCIFIIKLDPKQGVQINYSNLTVSVLENILPDSNDRVHKCAIIRLNKPDSEEAELFVMDKQQKEGEPARFFIDTYLQADELLNDRIITREVVREAKDRIISILPDLDQNKIFGSIDREFSNGSRIELKTAIKNVLLDNVPSDKEDRKLFIENTYGEFVREYLNKYPEHQTTFTVERKDRTVVYRGEKDQIYFRYNKGILTKIGVDLDTDGNTIIKVDKSLNFKRDLK